ncbi:MAG: histidine phosphatase family protein, partial [Planctomycetota bacterium]
MFRETAPETPRRATLFVARHGEVDARWRRTVYGRLDVALSERGEEQSRRMAAFFGDFELGFVVSSGLVRAETAARLVRAGQPHLTGASETDARFLELNRGAWAGKPLAELEAEDPEGIAEWRRLRGALRAPGGESPAELAERTLPAFEDCARRAAEDGRPGLVVAHLWVVRSAVARALGAPMER